jgi:spore germination protein YaaH
MEESAPQLDERANVFHAISPFPFHARGVTIIGDDSEAGADFDEFIDDAQGRGIPVIPTIVDSTAPGVMAGVLADRAERAAHVEAIAGFAADGDYDGVDIDYENFAFEDGRDTWATTRPNWVAFVEELGTRLHADGRTLTVSLPWIIDDERTDDSGYWVYDYAGIAPFVDVIRIMAYDYSTDEPGPMAPLDWVEDIVDAATEAAGGPEKLVLGIPLYGRNWVIATDGECPEGTPDRQDIRLVNVDERIAERSASPTFDPVTGESSFTYDVDFPEGATDPECTQTRQVNYMDAEGAQLRMQLSVDRGLLGVSLFAFGYDDEALWQGVAAVDASLETTASS